MWEDRKKQELKEAAMHHASKDCDRGLFSNSHAFFVDSHPFFLDIIEKTYNLEPPISIYLKNTSMHCPYCHRTLQYPFINIF